MKNNSLSRRGAVLALAFSVYCLCSFPARAGTIAENTAGGSTSSQDGYWGQSFTTSAGSFGNITINFFSSFDFGTGTANTPYALGTGFLLSLPYTGNPSAFDCATDPGCLGQATASGGFYTFASGVTLAGSTQYFFYENAVIPTGAIWGGNVYGGGQAYFTPTDAAYNAQGGSIDFRVTGTSVSAVPDSGASVVLLSVTFVGILFLQHILGGRTFRAFD